MNDKMEDTKTETTDMDIQGNTYVECGSSAKEDVTEQIPVEAKIEIGINALKVEVSKLEAHPYNGKIDVMLNRALALLVERTEVMAKNAPAQI